MQRNEDSFSFRIEMMESVTELVGYPIEEITPAADGEVVGLPS